MAKPENPYARIYRGFREQTAQHELVVLHEEGLNRHLRVQAPGTRMWSWDITTWPGHLAVSGDVGAGFMFAREPDMLEFFSFAGKVDGHYSDGAPSIDHRYWAEKIVGPARDAARAYDSDAFARELPEHLEEHESMGTDAEAFRARQIELLRRIDELRRRCAHNVELPSVEDRLAEHWAGRMGRDELFSYDDLGQAEMDRLGEEFDVDEDGERTDHDLFALEWAVVAERDPAEQRQEILDEALLHSDSEHEAHAWLRDNEERLGTCDTWEWDLREYDSQFLFACYCIDIAVRLHRERRSALEAAQTQKER